MKNIHLCMAWMLKLPVLTIRKKGDPKQVSKDWEEYVEGLEFFLGAIMAIAAHANPEVVGTPCVTCRATKILMILIGGSEVKRLFNHVRKITETPHPLQIPPFPNFFCSLPTQPPYFFAPTTFHFFCSIPPNVPSTKAS